jgi:hypothetical protein
MANRTPTSHHDDQTQPMPSEHEHDPVWSPSLKDWVCDICGEPVPDPDLTPKPGDYAPPDSRGHHAHDGERELHAQGDRPHYHDPDSGIVVFFDSAAPAPTGAASEVDPHPATSAHSEAATPADAMGMAAEPALTSGSGGTAGAGRPNRARDEQGRFIGRSREKAPAPLPTVVALEHALIDVDADLFLAGQHRKLEMGRTVLDAIAFGVEADRLETAMATYAGMLVQLPSGGERS